MSLLLWLLEPEVRGTVALLAIVGVASVELVKQYVRRDLG